MNLKKSAVPDMQMKYCLGWVAPKKKGCPKKDARKLGIADHVQQGTSKRPPQNPVLPETIVKKVDKDDAEIGQFEELKLEDTTYGIIRIA